MVAFFSQNAITNIIFVLEYSRLYLKNKGNYRKINLIKSRPLGDKAKFHLYYNFLRNYTNFLWYLQLYFQLFTAIYRNHRSFTFQKYIAKRQK